MRTGARGAGVSLFPKRPVDRTLFIASAATCLASMATWMIHSKFIDIPEALRLHAACSQSSHVKPRIVHQNYVECHV